MELKEGVIQGRYAWNVLCIPSPQNFSPAAAAWKESVKGERRGLLELIAGPRADFMRCALPRIKSTQTPSPSLGFRLRHFVTGGPLRRQ